MEVSSSSALVPAAPWATGRRILHYKCALPSIPFRQLQKPLLSLRPEEGRQPSAQDWWSFEPDLRQLQTADDSSDNKEEEVLLLASQPLDQAAMLGPFHTFFGYLIQDKSQVVVNRNWLPTMCQALFQAF